jgi:two-component system, sensor histidine kinase
MGRVAATNEETLARARRASVLLIEDDDDARETMQTVLESWGQQVTIAVDGVEGMEKALAHRPAVVLIDISLPRMDGYEIARQLRANSLGYKPTLIAMTGHGQPEDKECALDAGFDLHLVKPIHLVDLARALFRLICPENFGPFET